MAAPAGDPEIQGPRDQTTGVGVGEVQGLLGASIMGLVV